MRILGFCVYLVEPYALLPRSPSESSCQGPFSSFQNRTIGKPDQVSVKRLIFLGA